MTSRRSRLKAVTNLPVRRKVISSQGSSNEAASNDGSISGKVFLSGAKADDILASSCNTPSNFVGDKNLAEIPTENDSAVVLNCDFQNTENLVNENDVIKSNDLNNSEFLENSDLNSSCDLLSYRSENNNYSVLKTNGYFKENLILSAEREQNLMEICEKNKESEIPEGQNFIVNSNKDNNNSGSYNKNVVEDGLKCYTVLTSQNVTLTPLAEYTITPLTPCVNTFIDSTISDLSAPQEYEEVQIYSETGPTELCISSETGDNCESITETQSLEPVLANLSNNDQVVNSLNIENANSNIAKIKNTSESFVPKSVLKNRTLIFKNNFNGNDEHFSNSVTTRDSQVLENVMSSGSGKISSDSCSYKQSRSTVRRKRTKGNDFNKKLADAKREFQKKYEKTKPDRSSLKMIDLIFYNPASNPMESKAKIEKKEILAQSSETLHNLLEEEKVDEPESLDCNSRSNFSDNCETDNLNKMPVPQVKIGLNGEIILDEKSLVIETTDAKKGREGLLNSVPIFEDRGCKVSYYRGKSKKTRDWADFETKRFYKALNTIGPDFTLMQKYFPKRSRLELKNKFKREERLNRNLIDKALNNPSEFDMTQLEKDLAIEKEAEEEEIEMRLCRIVKQSTKKPKVKSSLLSREMIDSDGDSENSQSKLLDVDYKKMLENEKNKKEKEFDFVFQKLLMKESEKSREMLPTITSSSLSTFERSDQEVT